MNKSIQKDTSPNFGERWDVPEITTFVCFFRCLFYAKYRKEAMILWMKKNY